MDVQIEEWLVQGETRWVAIRARGAEWSWLTPREAAAIGRYLLDRFNDEALAAPEFMAAE